MRACTRLPCEGMLQRTRGPGAPQVPVGAQKDRVTPGAGAALSKASASCAVLVLRASEESRHQSLFARTG